MHIDIKLIEVNYFKQRANKSETEIRMVQNELAGIEPVQYVIRLAAIEKNLTTNQVKEILTAIGFNIYPILADSKKSDFAALMNVKGFVLPFWDKLPSLFPKKLEKLLLTQYSPGKERLHIRLYDNGGIWYITAHTDYNWINPNLLKVYKAHFTHGAGNYEFGTVLMVKLLLKFEEYKEQNKRIGLKEVISLVKEVYLSNSKEFYDKLGEMIIS